MAQSCPQKQLLQFRGKLIHFILMKILEIMRINFLIIWVLLFLYGKVKFKSRSAHVIKTQNDTSTTLGPFYLILTVISGCKCLLILKELRPRSLVVSVMHSESKSSLIESGCQLCAEVSFLQQLPSQCLIVNEAD